MLEKVFESIASSMPGISIAERSRRRTFVSPVVAEFLEARAFFAENENDETDSVCSGCRYHHDRFWMPWIEM